MIGGKTFTEKYAYSDGASGDGSLVRMTLTNNAIINYTYDALKRLTNKDVKNSANAVVAYAYKYKDTGTTNGVTTTTPLVAQLDVTTMDGSRPVGAKYTYDALGNITQISQSVSPYYPLVKYTYDSQNQLTKEEHYNGNGTATSNITKTYEYAYDAAGNILTEKVDGTVTKTYTYSTGQWLDKLLAFNGTVFSYDLNGNPLTYANSTYRYTMLWEHGRQLYYTGVDNGSGISDIFYRYDADGIRTKKIVNGVIHEYLTQNGKVVRETIGSGSTAKVLDFIYDESGKPCEFIYTNGTATPLTYYYVLNLQGDVVGLVNANGESKADYTYNAWGELLSSSGTMAEINPLRYRGYYYDSETGWYYLQSRYYDPALHRFINADSFTSTGQGFIGTNMFAYCNNCPVILGDSSGNYCTYVVQETDGGAVKSTLRDVTDEINTALSKAAAEGERCRVLVDESLLGNVARIFLYVEFYHLVNHEAPWDIKREKSWTNTIGTTFPGTDAPVIYDGMVMTPESLGNFTYGYLGHAYGIPRAMLIGGSYYAADFPIGGALLQNEISDWRYIMLGYSYYR